ncbi:origin recognition complex subunit 2-like [Eurytemora carolleeae]|uniref:origin recognition complex subunit 2-like n=1 Tax=Eurytemora carolleeae TaxID=1294199 RepID=UPI000C763A4E|nr:origin recognition complex subunit 2-like [Eurytemora carolleeae]|eukprot:XP_023343930.1 origin recognition complex subunit 2-like [Eurytemora affinis]
MKILTNFKFHFFRNMVRVRVVFKHDSDAPEMNTTGDEISRVLRTRNSNGDGSRRNSVCVGGSLEGIAEEEEEFMFSKASQLAEETESAGKDVFGFKTPKKSGSMVLKAQEELNRTPRSARNTPNFNPSTPRTPRTGSRTTTPSKVLTPRSGRNTPVRGILKTPIGKQRLIEPDTPLSSRKRVKKTLIQISEEVETNRFSDSGSESSEEDCMSNEENERPILRGPPATPRTPARRGRTGKEARELNAANMAESYFEAQSAKVLTSDRTLNKLNTPRLSQEQVSKILETSKLRYKSEIQELVYDHKVNYPKWLSLLHRGYSIVTYGLGSKKYLIHDFQQELLTDDDCVVVNGFFPSLTLKSILTSISEDILEIDSTFSSNPEHVDAILSGVENDLYLLIHNIDGSMLRNEKTQSVLADLASHPKIHLVCSIDHINAPLIWDQLKLARFNFIWFDATTFLPYTDEAAGESMMVKASGGLQLASITHVLAALTPNAKRIFLVLAKYQIEHQEAHYPGIAFMELYSRCRNEFLVSSDLELKAQLTEFRDHKLVGSRRGGDGAEYLKIPIDKTALASYIENIEDRM